MNVQEYISSGIIESYVLGLASPEESAEFERMCATHSEVRTARDAFENQLEQSLLKEQVQPPRELKSRIFSEIGMEKTRNGIDSQHSPVVPFRKPERITHTGAARYVAAASLILLAGSVLLNFYLATQYKKSITQYKELAESQTRMAANNQSLQTKLETYDSAFNLMKSPLMAIVKMGAVPTSPSPASMATVFWNTSNKDVYILVNQLPKNVSDKQYQLWALVDGKPVDAGTFDAGTGISFVKMKTIPKAQAFAVTLEKRGGSPTPTMTAMYVLGKVTG